MIRRILILFSFMWLFMAITCDNEPYEGDIVNQVELCESIFLETLEASDNFTVATDDNYNILCQTYRDALQDQIDQCGDPTGELQEFIDALGDCLPQGPSACDLATEATENAFQEFLEASDMEYESKCNAYVNAIENQIAECGDDASLQALIDELGDCQPVFFDIVGDWKLIKILSDIPRDLNNDGETTNNYLEDMDCFENETITFNADGTGTIFYRSYTEIEVTSLDGSPDNLEFTVECFDQMVDVEFTWYQDGNLIPTTILSDGSMFSFFRNGDHIFIAMRDNFVATSTSPNIDSIEEDLIYEYIQF